jgi:hypothetical protein
MPDMETTTGARVPQVNGAKHATVAEPRDPVNLVAMLC